MDSIPKPKPGWRLVTKEEFYRVIGQFNCHPDIDEKYNSQFRMQDSTRRVVGYTERYGPHPYQPEKAYFLPRHEES